MLGYLSCIEEMLLPEKGRSIPLIPYYAALMHYQIEWVRELPRVLLHMGEKYLSIKEDIAKEEPAKEESAKKQHLLILCQYMKVPDILILAGVIFSIVLI